MSVPSSIREAMRLCDQMRAAGASKADIHRSLELHLRAAWTWIECREYDCDTCSDTGLELFRCPNRPCARRKAHADHDYVRPCFCAKGEMWKVKPQTDQSVLEAAAKTAKKAHSFARPGR